MKRLIYLFLLAALLSSSYLSAQNSKCATPSKEMLSFIDRLKKENYKLNMLSPRDSLVIQTPGKANQFKFKNMIGFHAKSRVALKNGLRVRFSVYEICFNNTNESIIYENRIDRIINGKDLYNEKNYDFIVRNGNRLIYISTDARIFQEPVLEQRNKLVARIKSKG